MLKTILTFLFFVSSVAALNAQQVVDVDKFEGNAMNLLKTVGGEPISTTKFVQLVEGSPYFQDQWLKGSVFVDQKEYRNLFLRVNIYETSLEFKDLKGEKMVCTQPVKRVLLRDSATSATYNFVHSAFLPSSPDIKNSWLLELASGNASLYKLSKKQLNEIRPYGSATTEQHILTSYSYYILANNNFTRVKKLADVVELLANKKTELEQYIKSNKLSNKEEADMIKLVSYYNSL